MLGPLKSAAAASKECLSVQQLAALVRGTACWYKQKLLICAAVRSDLWQRRGALDAARQIIEWHRLQVSRGWYE